MQAIWQARNVFALIKKEGGARLLIRGKNGLAEDILRREKTFSWPLRPIPSV